MLKICLSSLILFLILGVAVIKTNSEEPRINYSDCITKTELLEVRGGSLAPLINQGEIIKLLHKYYNCRPLKREDIIAYNYAGNNAPLIKIVKGIEGDKFQLKKSVTGCWNILINDKILKNSQKMPYCINEQGYRMLSLYEKDYSGFIPKDAYLILGNQPDGSLDSTRFGLVSRKDLLGKVVKL